MLTRLSVVFGLFFLLSNHSVSAWSSEVEGFAPDRGSRVREIFRNRCAECHGPGSKGSGGFAQILDFAFLRTSPQKYVVPGNPDASQIYLQIQDDTMPDRGPPLSAVEKIEIRTWIQEGALDPVSQPNERITLSAIAAAVTADLEKVPAADRKHMRYISFAHLYNLGADAARLEVLKQALSKLLNSLSQAKAIFQPRAVGTLSGTLFRFDLRLASWDKAKWIQLERAYPYFIRTAEMKRLLELTETKIPLIHGDWLMKFATLEPLYSTLIGHPDRSDLLEASLGVNVAQNLVGGKAARAGFARSGVSSQNRIIERHPIPSRAGSYWLSYDFASSFGRKDIRSNPFGPDEVFPGKRNFLHDGGEIIYHLPNGMQAYMLVNAKKGKINDAPFDIIQDPNPRRHVVSNAVSCMACHALGLKDGNFDVVYANAVSSGQFAKAELAQLAALYAPKEKLADLYAQDNAVFQKALVQAGVPVVEEAQEQVNSVVFEFDDDLRLNKAAETLGISPEVLKRVLDQDPKLGQISAQLQGIGVPRFNFIKVFGALANASRIGEPVNAVDLQAEIDETASGGFLALPPGSYEGNFVIDKPINIVGQGSKENVVISGSFTIKSFQVFFQNVTFVATEAHRPALTVKSGNTRVDSCAFSSTEKFGKGILIQSNASVQVNRGSFSGIYSPVIAKDTARAEVLDTFITGAGYGVDARDKANVTVSRSRIFESTIGVFIGDSAGGLVCDSEIAPGQTGIFVHGVGNVNIEGNKILKNAIVGITVFNGPSLTILRNTIDGNATGIQLAYDLKLPVTIKGNRILNNRDYGIIGAKKAKIVAPNEFSGNKPGDLRD